MYKAIYFLIVLFCFSVQGAELLPLNPKFVHALGWVESKNNPNSVGDSGKSVGIYQIQWAAWYDAKEFNPKIGGEYKDCYNVEYALKVLTSYLNRYEPAACRNNDFKTLAKCWNGGPTWRKKNADVQKKLDIYWQKIKENLHK